MQTLRVVFLVIAQYFSVGCFGFVICEQASDQAPVICKPPQYTSTDVYVEPRYPEVTDIPQWVNVGITSASAYTAGISTLFSNMHAMLAFLLSFTKSVKPHDNQSIKTNAESEWNEQLLAALAGQANDDLPVRRAGNSCCRGGGTCDQANSSQESSSENEGLQVQSQPPEAKRDRKDEPPEDDNIPHSWSNTYCAACNKDYCEEPFKNRILIPEERLSTPKMHPDGSCIPFLSGGIVAEVYKDYPQKSPQPGQHFSFGGTIVFSNREETLFSRSVLHHFNPAIESTAISSEDKPDFSGYEIFYDNALKRMFGLTEAEIKVLRRILLASALLENRGARYTAMGRIMLAYCSCTEECFIALTSVQQHRLIPDSDDLSFFKKIALAIYQQTGFKCGSADIYMNIQLKSAGRLRWHEDKFNGKEFEVIYTAVTKTPATGKNDGSFLELGLVEDKYNAFADLTSLQFSLPNDPPQGFVKVGTDGKIQQLLLNDGTVIYDKEKGFMVDVNEPLVYLLTRIPEKDDAGYGIKQQDVYKVSDGITTKRFKIIHSGTPVNIPDEVQSLPKTNEELLEYLHRDGAQSANDRRNVIIFRVNNY